MSTSEDAWKVLRSLPMGERIEVTDTNGCRWTGTVIPPHELSGDRVLSLKLASGYNVGIRIGSQVEYRRLAPSPTRRVEAQEGLPPSATTVPDDGRTVDLLTTGGTIASRVDYETGGVRPVSDEKEILEFYPELKESGGVRVVPVLDRLSENIAPSDWLLLADKVVASFARGASGVVIAHGTDTLGFTAAGLSFLLADLPGPVVLVGAQRSPDRPSSDGPSNIAAAVAVARDRRLGEVVVVMHETVSDGRFSVHRGCWVRKMHASRRDAFESLNGPPLGTVEGTSVHLLPDVRPPARGPPRVDGPIDERAGLLWFYPGLSPQKAAQFVDGLRGVVLAGTGLGHVSSVHTDWIRAATKQGVVVAMTTQCLSGTVDPYVYATGRDLLRSGVLYLDDLLPETAYAKMAWALGRARAPEEVRRLLSEDRAGEFHHRRRPEATA